MSIVLRIYPHTRRSLGSSQRLFQGYPRRVTSIPFFLKPCLKATRIYPPAAYRKHPIGDFGAPRFMFYVYGFDLSDRIWLVAIVMALVVPCLLGCFFYIIFWMELINDSRRFTLHTFLFVSFAEAAHDVCSFLKLNRLPSAS